MEKKEFEARTEAMAVALLSAVFGISKGERGGLLAIRREMDGVREEFLARGYLRAASLLSEIRSLLKVIADQPAQSRGLSKLEGRLLIEGASALLADYYDEPAGSKPYAIPFSLIEGIRSCSAVRMHELDYLEGRKPRRESIVRKPDRVHLVL